MPAAPKYQQVMSVIERRVRAGDYLLRDIPGERKIAEETGVSYMTARAAVSRLLEQQVLIRRPNGALEAHPRFGAPTRNSSLVLLYPEYPSPYLARLRQIVTDVVEARDVKLRPALYVHWDDPIVKDVLDASRGTLIVPSTEEIPPHVIESIRASRAIVLDGDLTDHGIPSVRLFPERHLRRVFEHLADQGHESIDCVNTQPHNPEISSRINAWQTWRGRAEIDGVLWDQPASSYSDPTPTAYELMRDVLQRGAFTATAVVCTTFPAAVGTIRAFWEYGYEVGRSVAICSMNIESPARHLCPSVTGLDMPDLAPTLVRCLDWFSAEAPWSGRLTIEPRQPVFFAGESTSR